ncbi:hypothetical protein [Brevibacillus daliensis]|uniref:hypothetical protein n=1 Tax=Brevibacillus daliensis TaxID=2892995 RepID=UPI001E458694|nr:hypothetical protein [Brevibacillus daliensis]
MKKILFTGALVLTVVVILSWLIVLYQRPSMPGDSVSDKKIISELSREYNSIKQIEVSKLWLDRVNKEVFNDLNSYLYEKLPEQEVEEDKFRLFISTKGEKWGDDVKNFEVEAAMRAWVYLYNRKYDLPIALVESHFRPTGGITANYSVVIGKSEFEQYYGELTGTSLSEEEIAKELAERWVKATGYSRIKETK